MITALAMVAAFMPMLPADAYNMGKVGEYQAIAAGNDYTAVIKEDGSLWTWGYNEYGQLGDGTREDKSTPVKIMDNVTAVSAGGYLTAAIKEDGSLWTWGWNNYGQLGDGTMENKSTPVKIMDNVVAVSAGYNHTAAIKEDGSLWTWGYNGDGQLGDGTTEAKSTPVKIIDNVDAVYTGRIYTAAIKEDGSLWTWGHNGDGQLGDGTRKDKTTPVKIMDNVATVSTGYGHTAAIKEDGSLWIWGYNVWDQLGDGTGKDKTTPIKIMDNVAAVSAGRRHTAAIKEEESLWTWGYNGYGQLGDGTRMTRSTPVKIMDNVAAVSAGYNHTVAIKEDGSLWAWGRNSDGQLGDGTTENRSTPVKIMDGVRVPGGNINPSPQPTGKANIVSLSPEDGSTVDLWDYGSLDGEIEFDKEIKELGSGKIYLHDYNTGCVVREIYPDGSSDDPDVFYKKLDKENTIGFTMSLTNPDQDLIFCDRLFYITMDPNAVVFENGTVFDGINNKDEWTFSTGFGLTRYYDMFSFENAANNFFENDLDSDWNFKNGKQNPYPIASSDIANKIKSIIHNGEYKRQTAKKKTFGGACFGMSMVTVLSKLNKLNINEFSVKTPPATNLYDAEPPKSGTNANGVRDLINYYQLLQYADEYIITTGDKLKANIFRNENAFKTVLHEIVNKGLSMDKSKTPLVINFAYKDGKATPLHAVTLLSARPSDNGGYDLLINDPNKVGLTTMERLVFIAVRLH